MLVNKSVLTKPSENQLNARPSSAKCSTKSFFLILSRGVISRLTILSHYLCFDKARNAYLTAVSCVAAHLVGERRALRNVLWL